MRPGEYRPASGRTCFRVVIFGIWFALCFSTQALAQDAETKAEKVSTVSAAMWMLGLVCIGLSIFIVVVAIAFRRFARGDAGVSATTPVVIVPEAKQAAGEAVGVRVEDDGFWLSDELPAGASVACRYRIGGQKRTAEVIVSETADSRFVCTGSRPEDVIATRVPEASGND